MCVCLQGFYFLLWCKLERASCLIDHTAAVCNDKLLACTHTQRLPPSVLMRVSLKLFQNCVKVLNKKVNHLWEIFNGGFYTGQLLSMLL